MHKTQLILEVGVMPWNILTSEKRTGSIWVSALWGGVAWIVAVLDLYLFNLYTTVYMEHGLYSLRRYYSF
jgi:hypothetical protein